MHEVDGNSFRLPNGVRAEWDPEGGIKLLSEDGVITELLPTKLERLSRWVLDNNIERYHIYYRRKNKDHIIRDGEVLCHHNVGLEQIDDSEELRPLTEMTRQEYRLLPSLLCRDCRSRSERAGLIPTEPMMKPEFPCPKCKQGATTIYEENGVGKVNHGDGVIHEIEYDVYERWRRGRDSDHPSYRKFR